MASKYNRDDYNLTVYEVKGGEIRVRQVLKRESGTVGNFQYFYIRTMSGKNFEKRLHTFQTNWIAGGKSESRRIVFENYEEAVAELRYLQVKNIEACKRDLARAEAAFAAEPVVKIWN